MPIWNESIECASRETIRAIQEERFQNTIQHVYKNVPYYRHELDERDINPQTITLDEISRLPFTDKETMRDNFPFSLFAVPIDKIVRLHSSSGTTGKPVVAGYTHKDLETWSECIARLVTMAGVDHNDRAQMSFKYGMFTGGWGLHYGLERVGAMVIPAGAGNTDQHLQMMQDYQSTVLISTPSYAFHLSERAHELGIGCDQLNLKVGLFGGEPCSDQLKIDIEDGLGINVTNNYGLTEVMGPGVSGECLHNDKLHIAEDHFYLEIIDPDTGEVLPEGEQGELVITTLTKEAMPLLRYRTHDISRLVREPCECGRTTLLMEKVRSRTDDMLIIKGVNLFPSQIEDVLSEIEGITSQFRIIVERESGIDSLEIQSEITEDVFTDSMAELERFRRQSNERLDRRLGLRVKLSLMEPGSLGRTQGKTKKVIDNRKL